MHYKTIVKSLSAAAVLSVTASIANAGPIATMDLEWEKFAIGAKSGNITSNGTTLEGLGAGKFRFSVSNYSDTGQNPLSLSSGDVLDAFCVDINTSLDQSNAVQYSLVDAENYFNNSSKVDQIGRLFTGYNSFVTDAQNSAAFQLALWEIINEGDEEAGLKLETGTFTSTEFGGARSTANDWLTGLSDQESGFSLFVLSSGTNDEGRKLSQDLLVFSPTPPVKVPEPGTLALVALGVCGLLVRKQSRRATS